MLYSLIFWLSAAIIVWIFGGYLLTILVLSRIFARPTLRGSAGFEPSVSIVIPTRNEADQIREKLLNALALEYPPEKVEILVVDDASTDDTTRIAESLLAHGRSLRIIRKDQRLGKSHSIHLAINEVRGDLVFCTDADCFFEPGSLRKLVSYFEDPSVGGVSAGVASPSEPDVPFNPGCGLYWKIDRKLKCSEACLHSIIGFVGACAVFRREIFSETEHSDWTFAGGADDSDLSYFIIRRGYRILFAEEVLVREDAARTYSDFMAQKARMVAQNIRSCFKNLSMFGLRHGWYSALIMPTRRLLITLSPFLLALNFASALALGGGWDVHSLIAAVHVAVYTMGIVYYLVPATRGALLLQAAHYFLLCNCMLLNAWYKALSGTNLTVWEPIESSRVKRE